jgi:hypothetical protein
MVDLRLGQGRMKGAQLGGERPAGALVDGPPRLGILLAQAFDGSRDEGIVICHFDPA